MTIHKTLHDSFINTVFSDDTGATQRILLSPLTAASYLYQAAMAVRHRCYKTGILQSHNLSIPVISIGNISVGGTGKTPATLFLAKLLQKEGKQVAVVSRGYKGTASGPVNVVSDGTNVLLSVREAGDEPFMLAHRLPGIPILTGTDRALAGEYAQKELSAQVVVLDDGFQHLRLKRDVDIVLLDQERPFGNGHLLPRGSLRESPQSLGRAHFAILTLPHRALKKNRPGPDRLIRTYTPDIPIYYAHYAPAHLTTLGGKERIPYKALEGKQVVALAGVGRPGSFVALLKQLGAQIEETRLFPDHHHYRLGDLAIAKPNVTIVTTEKDAVKLKPLKLKDKDILVLSVTLQLADEARFFTSLKKCLPSLL